MLYPNLEDGLIPNLLTRVVFKTNFRKEKGPAQNDLPPLIIHSYAK